MPCHRGRSPDMPKWIEIPFMIVVILVIVAAIVSNVFPQWLTKLPL